MHIATTFEMAQIDQRAQDTYAIDGRLLMEQAGTKAYAAAVSWLREQGHKTERMVFLSGGGNNGGDALVMAREALISGVEQVSVIYLQERCSDQTALQRTMYDKLGGKLIEVHSPEVDSLLHQADVIIDGLVGTGLKQQLRAGDVRSLIERVNALQHPAVIALDLPSGLTEELGGDAVFMHASCTITFGLPKEPCFYPHTRTYCGHIITLNPGFPKQLLDSFGRDCCIRTPQEFSLPHLPSSSYKNTKGHLAVFAGSTGYTGAAVLCAEAALRARTGLVTLYCDQDIYPIVASHAVSVMVKPLAPGMIIHASELAASYDAVLAGPGWGTGVQRELQIREVLHSALPATLDADAIPLVGNLLETGQITVNDLSHLLLTPHPGEFAKLTGHRIKDHPGSMLRVLRSTAEALGCVIMVKSHVNYMCDPHGNIIITEGMNPAMGTAGSGDVLSGIAAGLTAQHLSTFDAVSIGNAIHQLTGALAFSSRGWFIAEDLLDHIGMVIKRMEKDDLLDHTCSLD